MSGMATLRREGPSLFVRTPYLPDLIEELKRRVPHRGRRWHRDTKEWEIFAGYEDRLYRLLWEFGLRVLDQEADPQIESAGSDDPFAVLYLRPNAPAEVVEAAYRTLARLWHPDLHPAEAKEQATARMARLNLAIERIRGSEEVRASPPGASRG